MESTISFDLCQIPLALDRWKRIRTDHELKDNAEVLELLLQHYENTVQGFQTLAFCGECLVPLALSCPKCSDAHAPPPLNAKDDGRAAKPSDPSEPPPEPREPLPSDLDANLSQAGVQSLAEIKPKCNDQGGIVINVKDGYKKASGAVIESLASKLRYNKKQKHKISQQAVFLRHGVTDQTEKEILRKCKSMTTEELKEELKRFLDAGECDSKAYSVYVRQYVKANNGSCPICDKKMRANSQALHRHLYLHMPNVQIKCSWCAKTFSTPGQQYWHERKVHREPHQRLQATLDAVAREGTKGPSSGRKKRSAKGAAAKTAKAKALVADGGCSEERVQAISDADGPGTTGTCSINESSPQGTAAASALLRVAGLDAARQGTKGPRSSRKTKSSKGAAAKSTKALVAVGGGNDIAGDDTNKQHGTGETDDDDNNVGSGQGDPSVGDSPKSPSLPGQSATKSRAVLPPPKPKIDPNKWNNLTVEELNQQLLAYVAKSQHETKEYMFFLNTYLQKAYNGRCLICNKAIKKKTYLLRRHLCQHMPNPQLKCGWCDEAFHSVHKWYWHERRVHRRPGLPQASPTVDTDSVGASGSNVDISDRRHLSALKVMCNTILAKWDQMGEPEMQAELLRIVKESTFEGEEFTLFLSKYVKDFYSGSCVICNKQVHKNMKNFGNHLFVHMPNAKASCYYCSSTFESLLMRGVHMREAHRDRFRRRQRPGAKGSNMQMAASLKNSNDMPHPGSPSPLAVSNADGEQQGLKSESERSSTNAADGQNSGGESLGQSRESEASCSGDPGFQFLLNGEKRPELEAEMTQRLKMFVEKGDCESQEFMQFIAKYRQMFCGACPLCSKKLSRNIKDVGNFVRHLVRHMPNPNIRCTTCLLSFRSLAARETHIFKYHGGACSWVCELCGAGFHTKSRFNIHNRTCQKVSYGCRHCAQKFSSRHFRFKHEKREHAVRKREHVCFRCGKVLNSPGELRTHLNTHTGEKIFQCYLCPKGFYSRQGLTYHMADHTSMPNRFSCDVCNKEFRWKKNLTKHLQSHNTSRPFPCQDCGKAFKERGHLTKHQRLHTGERPYPCPEPGCGRAFITSCKRKDHCQRVHGYPAVKMQIVVPDFQSEVAGMT